MSGLENGLPGRGLALILVASILMFLTVIVVALRLVARIFILRVPGSDDWCVLAATIVAIGTVISMDLGVKYGTGKPDSSQDINVRILGKVQLATQVLYILSSGLIKLSILFLYRRIFQNHRILIILSIVLIALITIAFSFAAIFQCRPTGVLWANLDGSHNSCISILIFWCDVAVIFLVSNVWIVVLPIKPIIGLHLALRKRMAILGLLCSAGLLACAAAAVRLAFVIHLYRGHDPPLDIVPIYLCSIVELSTALMACSVPALRQALPECRGYLKHAKDRFSDIQTSASSM